VPVQLEVEERRRTAILDAAGRLIAERGYHAVRIADIAPPGGHKYRRGALLSPARRRAHRRAVAHRGRAFERQSPS